MRRVPDELPSTSNRRTRSRIGIALVGVGLVVAIAAVAAGDRDGGTDGIGRPVGRLIASNGIGSSTTAAEAATTTTTVAPKGWPPAVQWRPAELGVDGAPAPATAPDIPDGAYVWRDFNGWHLWFVGAADAGSTVTIESNEPFARAVASAGSPSVEVDGATVTVRRGDDPAAIVGIDFSPSFYGNSVRITTDGDLPLYLGVNREPATSPLELTRQR